MKYTLIFAFFWACCSINSVAYSQKPSIAIHNKTGIMLDSIQIDTFYLGQLRNDSSVIVLDINEFKISGPYPLLRVSAIDGSGKLMKSLAACGTKAVTVKEGHYAFDIILNNAGLNPHLQLILHR
jgi:hypothetical protein